MFLDPEVAAIGLNEQQAQDSRTPCQVSVYGYSLVNRAIAMRAMGGFVKLLLVTTKICAYWVCACWVSTHQLPLRLSHS